MTKVGGAFEYIIKLLEYDQYAFSWEQLKAETTKTDAALQNELSRLIKKKEIIGLRARFYVILTPRFRGYGKPPVELYVQKLFEYLKRSYYLAFYSAAAYHGAGHQQVQQDYLVTKVPNIRDIKKGVIHLNMFATSTWPPKNIIQKKSDAGYFNISSPALTIADLIHYQSKLGGLNRMFAIIEELAEEIDAKDIMDLLAWYPHVSTIQRLGYMLTLIEVDQEITDLLLRYLSAHRHYPVLLSNEKGRSPGSTGNPWKVDVNINLENDL